MFTSRCSHTVPPRRALQEWRTSKEAKDRAEAARRRSTSAVSIPVYQQRDPVRSVSSSSSSSSSARPSDAKVLRKSTGAVDLVANRRATDASHPIPLSYQAAAAAAAGGGSKSEPRRDSVSAEEEAKLTQDMKSRTAADLLKAEPTAVSLARLSCAPFPPPFALRSLLQPPDSVEIRAASRGHHSDGAIAALGGPRGE